MFWFWCEQFLGFEFLCECIIHTNSNPNPNFFVEKTFFRFFICDKIRSTFYKETDISPVAIIIVIVKLLRWFHISAIAFKTWLFILKKIYQAKTQEWAGYMQSSLHNTNTDHLAKFASDGCLINMLDMLLEYSMPFCNTPYNNKLLKINFNYADGKNTNIEGKSI